MHRDWAEVALVTVHRKHKPKAIIRTKRLRTSSIVPRMNREALEQHQKVFPTATQPQGCQKMEDRNDKQTCKQTNLRCSHQKTTKESGYGTDVTERCRGNSKTERRKKFKERMGLVTGPFDTMTVYELAKRIALALRFMFIIYYK